MGCCQEALGFKFFGIGHFLRQRDEAPDEPLAGHSMFGPALRDWMLDVPGCILPSLVTCHTQLAWAHSLPPCPPDSAEIPFRRNSLNQQPTDVWEPLDQAS